MSQSRFLAFNAARRLEDKGACVELVDLQEMMLPAFDNAPAHDHAGVVRLKDAIVSADAVVIAAPVYNWSLGSATKNMVEIPVRLVRTAGRLPGSINLLPSYVGGLPHSYTAYTGLASSMTLDFRCIINPYMVYATDRDATDGVFSEAVARRMQKTVASD
ncbi:NAD(P)H-dependent FMN reductase [Arthrobacter globiformis]|nr:NAD(P)H-dependent FMN reductase [Arthrobacter globiformis]